MLPQQAAPRILLLGANGQVGKRLASMLPVLGGVVALNRSQCDLANVDQLLAALEGYAPTVIVNAAAYTAVDKAETDADAAYAVNADALAVIGLWAASHNALVFHYSTDYVFDGAKVGRYQESDATNPLNVYGTTKLLGERILADTQAKHIIMRTSWVYDSSGSNFVNTMLRLGLQRSSLSVVADQMGSPTSARQIAQASFSLLSLALQAQDKATFSSGVYHFSASGVTSWHGFAEAIFSQVQAHYQRLAQPCPLRVSQVLPIATSEYPTAAVRPLNSCLDCSKIQSDYAVIASAWQTELAVILDEIYPIAAL